MDLISSPASDKLSASLIALRGDRGGLDDTIVVNLLVKLAATEVLDMMTRCLSKKVRHFDG